MNHASLEADAAKEHESGADHFLGCFMRLLTNEHSILAVVQRHNIFSPYSDSPTRDPFLAHGTLAVNERFLATRIPDYFLAKMLKLTRPGGIVAALTSYGTLDKHTT